MLTPEETKAIDEEHSHNAEAQGACIEALKIVQQRRGWVSDESLSDVASYLGLSPDYLDGVATFYNRIFRKPVGRHVIHLCTSISCWIKGCERIREAITNEHAIEFGQTSDGQEYTLLPVQCLGACDHAPAMMIDETLYEDVKPETVRGILAAHRAGS